MGYDCATLLKDVFHQNDKFYHGTVRGSNEMKAWHGLHVYTQLRTPVSYSKKPDGFVTHSYSLPLSFASTQLFSTKTMTLTKSDPSER
jgi:hypothetical protein